ncbi:hypothetical protein ACWEQL_07210 [Kitasatospora sp. NPDC004240]
MSIPGFTADSAVHRTNGHYRTASGGGLAGRRPAVTPQGLCAKECRGACAHQCSHNPWGHGCRECLDDCMATCDI